LTADAAEPTSGPFAIFSEVLQSVSDIATPGTSIELQTFDFAPLASAISSLSFYTYSGSLTTPPCSEGVRWFVATEPLSMAVDTYNALKDVVNFNSRFMQNSLGEQNLLSLSREALDRIEEEHKEYKRVALGHSPSTFRA
jgi:Eukaryotic-type carbonic anhydrase